MKDKIKKVMLLNFNQNPVKALNLKTQQILIAVFVFICLIYIGCEAPRDSQFDPASPSYNAPQAPEAITDLTVRSFDGLSCLLSWSSPKRAYRYVLYRGSEDWDGIDTEIAVRYSGELPGVKPVGQTQTTWIDLPSTDTLCWVMFSYSEDELLSPASNQLIIETPRVNEPANISGAIRSKRYERWGNFYIITFEVEAEVSDEDGIDSVWVQYQSVNIGKLTMQEDGIHYFGEFPSNDSLPGRNVEAMVGHPYTVWCKDMKGGLSVSEEIRLVRVLSYCPQTFDLPADTLDGDLTFTWEIYDTKYFFTYSIQVVHIPDSYIPKIVFSDSLIDLDTVEYTIQRVGPDDPLPSGPKYLLWTISVVDEFGNEARSKELQFNLRPYVEE